MEETLASDAALLRGTSGYKQYTLLCNLFSFNVYSDPFHKCPYIFHAFLTGVLTQMLPTAGFEEEAGTQVGQGLGQRCLFPIIFTAKVGNFTTLKDSANGWIFFQLARLNGISISSSCEFGILFMFVETF